MTGSVSGAVASTSKVSSPAGSNVPSKRSKGKSKVMTADSSDDDELDENGRKRKRHRMALACHECKRRKIKCDRQMPACGPCSKRGKGEECTWDLFSNGTGDGLLPPSIARTAELEAVAARVAHIEAFLRTLPPNLASFQVYSAPRENTALGDPSRKFIGGAGAVKDQEDTFSDTEDAAVNLENGVFGARMTALDKAGKGNAKAGERGPLFGGGPRASRFQATSLELTKALTSIVTTERPGDAYSKGHLAVEFDASPAEVERARADETRRIYRALPDRASVIHLVTLYFQRVSWLFHHLHAPTFLVELEAFHTMCDAGRQQEVDPLFLALLLMVLCVALDSTHASRSPLSLERDSKPLPDPLGVYSDEQLRALPERWFAAAQRALTLAEWETIPRVRSVQTIVLFTQYLQLCQASRGQPSQLVTWLAGAIRLSQVLGLHLLGSNPEVMPVDDPAWPPGKNSLKRESAKRLWGVLVYQDWLGASSKNRSYLISPFHFDTDDPLNLNDSDLSSIDWRVNPSPPSVLTDSSSDRVRIAMSRQVRKVFDAVVLPQDFTYETVLELDRGYRTILDSLPDRWTLESSAEELDQPLLRFQRHFALEGLHNRIFRLHRPFSTRGYSQLKYRYSTDACLKSARVVIVSTHNISNATRDIWYSYSHVMGAALVLFNDLFQSIDSDASASEIESKKDTLNLAAEIFARSAEITSPALQAVVEQGSKIITGLFRAEESRRTSRAAQHLLSASGGTPFAAEEPTEVESFAAVLQRISRSLNPEQRPHRGTPPPTRNIPSASNLNRAAQTALMPPLPSSTSLGQPSAGGLSGLAPQPDAFEWPFPNDSAPTDALSLSFFQELDLSVPTVGADGFDAWTGDEQYSSAAAFASLAPSLNPTAAYAAPTIPGVGPSGSVGGEWMGPDGPRGDAGGGAQLSSLLDQLGGGW